MRILSRAGSALLPAILCLLAGTAPRRCGVPPGQCRVTGVPRVFLWAWERPEDLRFLDPRETGVAYLDRTVLLSGDAVRVRPRVQPLRVPPGTYVIAVARVEPDAARRPRLSAVQRAGLVSTLEAMGRKPGVEAIQIDYDATVSERGFYREVLRDLRGRLPRQMRVTITALASWCIFDDWISGLSADEAIPMLFRMGAGEEQIRKWLAAGNEFRDRLCGQSAGISTDEQAPHLPAGRRVYVFHPRAWTETDVETALRRVESWP